MDTTFIAEPPAQGVRLARGGAGATTILVVDEGSKGYPWYVLVVAVERTQDGRDGLTLDGYAGPGAVWDADALWKASARAKVEVEKETTTPYLVRILDQEWPPNSGSLLVLLAYFSSIALAGAADRVGSRPLGGAGDPNWIAITAAVRTTLRDFRFDALGSGLIHNPRLAAPLATGAPSGTPASEPRAAAAHPAVTFALMSCLYPCDILDHMPIGSKEERGPADASLLLLGDFLDRAVAADGVAAPTLLLMAGDQVYVDATAGLFDPKSQDDRYRIPYATLTASRGSQAVSGRCDVDIRMMLDDHEIEDNWEQGDDRGPFGPGDEPPLRRGLDAYWQFQRLEKLKPGTLLTKPVWESFEHRDLHFFLGNTRTERQSRNAHDFRDRDIMGSVQFGHLTQWMVCSVRSGLPKFVLTPSMLLPRRLHTARDASSALCSDAWDGYPKSLHALLKWICDNEVRHLVFLSGDEHLGCDAAITVQGNGHSATFRSIHCPALYAPYPFANSAQEDFARHDAFSFTISGGTYHCTVDTLYPFAGDGFVLVTSRRSETGDKLDVDFVIPTLNAEASSPPAFRRSRYSHRL